jgi:RNA polymerase sigma-70 factor (ECF subfamily)
MHEALPEATLVRQARSGDRAAFDALVRRHFTAVYRMLHRLVGNHEDAEDLAQECFVRAWGALAWYDGDARGDGGTLRPWLRRIALHLAQDHHRRRGRRPAQTAEGLEALAADPLRDPQGELGRRELGARVAAGVESLPERLRSAFVLRVLEGLDYDEVGRSTGVTPATARTHVMQARRRLVRWLAPWLGSRGGGGER